MDTKTIIGEARGLQDRVAEFRRHIHRNPELSFQEKATAQYITSVLTAEGIECTPIAATGVLVRITGKGDPRRAVVLRADIDALPVREATGLPYASANEGVMHACGHDMHTAALMGALVILNRHREEIEGTLFGLFQPGEELLPGGASMVLIEDPFRDYDVRAFYGEHVEPELPTGVFGMKAGEYMASTDELYFTVRGVGGHGALRHNLKDPVEAAAALITELLRAGNTDDGSPSVLSIGRVVADGATNVIPDSVEMHGTLRTFDEELRAEIKTRIRGIAASLSEVYNVEIVADIRDGFPSVINSAELAAAARETFSAAFGEDAVITLERRMTGEDFGFYTRKYPSLFYRFGVGGDNHGCSRPSHEAEQPHFILSCGAGKLHSPVFNPDEDALAYAVAGLAILALKK